VILYLDCSSGVAGDMLAAALCDAAERSGLDGRGAVADALGRVGLAPDVARCEPTARGGLSAQAFLVDDRPGPETFPKLIAAIEGSDLPPARRERIVAAAERMASAEAEVHGDAVGKLHELAGLDTLVDLVAVVTLVELLGPGRVTASPPALGGGVIDGSHGRLSVPAPAVLSILRGLPTAGGDEPHIGELTTPTGAALLALLSDGFGPLPPGRPLATGVGAGARELADRPNVLRAVLIDETTMPAAEGGGDRDRLLLLETTIDDTTPEYVAAAADRLLRGRARDVWLTQVLMKKGRPGVTLHALVDEADEDVAVRTVFEETTTFGVRLTHLERRRLAERREEVLVDGEPVGVRVGLLDGEPVTVSPEYEDCIRAASRLGVTPRSVYERARRTAGN